jgi:quercetin dioxygenase-like cupin family protein
MRRTLLAIIVGALVAGGMSLARHDDHGKGEDYVKVLSQREITEKVDGKKAKATTVEVTLAPGQVEAAHRHPGPAFGYVLEGEYEWAINDDKPKILKAGDTFYEPTGCLHGVGRNPSKKNKAHFIAVVLHPEDAKDIVIPEMSGKKD